jgi:hypothetical protein
LGLFKLLVKHGEPINVDDMSPAVAAETPLLGKKLSCNRLEIDSLDRRISDELRVARILKYLAAIGTIDEIASDRYAANHLTNNLSEKVAEAGICH